MKGLTENDVAVHKMANKYKKHNKYRVAPPGQRKYNGRTYASKAEMEYAKELYMLKKGGEILEFIEQPRLWLGVPENIYYPDFFIIYRNSSVKDWVPGTNPKIEDAPSSPFYVDVKGVMTSKFRHTIKLWKNYGTLDLHIVKKKGKRFVTSEIISPKKG